MSARLSPSPRAAAPLGGHRFAGEGGAVQRDIGLHLSLTLISLDHVPDEVYAQVRPHFTDSELASLTLLVATINA
jgi:hypothetical protein